MTATALVPGMATTDDRIDLRPGATAPADARRFVRDVLAQWGMDSVSEIATLLVSEVVTNAVLHAGTHLTVAVARRGGHLRVEVEDRSPALPSPRHYRADAQTGRGLALVAAESSAWGSDSTGEGKVVWFEVPL